MSIVEGLIGPIAKLIDKIIPDPEARDRAKLELLKLEGSQEMEAIRTQMTAIIAGANSADPWTSRARPSFLYVMYALLLWAIPMGLIAAARPEMAKGIAEGMNAYLAGIPGVALRALRDEAIWDARPRGRGESERGRGLISLPVRAELVEAPFFLDV